MIINDMGWGEKRDRIILKLENKDPELTELEFRRVNFVGSEFGRLMQAIASSSNLEYLAFSDGTIVEHNFSDLVLALRTNTSLKTVSFVNMRIEHERTNESLSDQEERLFIDDLMSTISAPSAPNKTLQDMILRNTFSKEARDYLYDRLSMPECNGYRNIFSEGLDLVEVEIDPEVKVSSEVLNEEDVKATATEVYDEIVTTTASLQMTEEEQTIYQTEMVESLFGNSEGELINSRPLSDPHQSSASNILERSRDRNNDGGVNAI